MFNVETQQYSEENLASQMEFTLEALPFIKEIYPVNNEINMKKDYFYEVDAVGIGSDFSNYNLQFKVRQPFNADFVLLARKLSGKAAMNNNSLGFTYKESKYSFTPYYDYIVERIKGNDYIVSREQIHSMEFLWPDTLERAISLITPKEIFLDDGSKAPTGLYYVYIPIDILSRTLLALLKVSNPNMDFDTILFEQDAS